VKRYGRDLGLKVMGDNLACPDKVAAAREMEDLGCDFIIHHVGFDERRGAVARGEAKPSPLDQLREIVEAVGVPVQAVGGLSIEQALWTLDCGAPLIVIGEPLAVDSDAFKTAKGDIKETLRLICDRVHGYGDVPVGRHS
jgi:3-hexulose-6-phosphate synthase/6-phospho-3-hexuloisomerase